MLDYVVQQLDDVTLTGATVLAGMDLMNPFVVREAAGYRIMVRGGPDPLGPLI